MLRLLIRIASMRFDEFDAILMSTHNIQFHDKISEELRRTQKQVRISHGKRSIWIRTTLY